MADGLIMFVHGLGGSAVSTWGRFPELIAADARFDGYGVGFFEYPTSLFRIPFTRKQPRIQTLGDALATTLDVRYPDHDPVVLVAHSLGGLICRQFLIDRVMAEASIRARKLLLYAVPNDGSGLANIASHIPFRHGQLRQLVRQSDVVVNLNRAWEALRMGDKEEIWSVIAACDAVVDEASARALPGTNCVKTLPTRGHIDCVKPQSVEDLTYQIFAQFALGPLAIKPNINLSGGRKGFKVVAFDLDGTLIRGLTFSWTRVWRHLGYEEKVAREGMLKYLRKEITYGEWCQWAVDMFRIRDLKQSDFRTIAEGLALTKNLVQAIESLKAQGYVTGIISGGIDSLLYEMIPDAKDLFDHIYINELKFDAAGVISAVRATSYDFEGKLGALEKMAAEAGVTLDECVFVGEGFNDAFIGGGAGLSIAYPPHSYSMEAVSHVQIAEDDLLKVVEVILSRRL